MTSADIAGLSDRLGRLDVDREARLIVRPDLERLLDIDASAVDRAAFIDDALLIACSPWVRERNSVIATVAGILATFRAPVTKQAPVLATLLAGLWDRWRNRTYADFWMKGLGSIPLGLGGLLSAPPRAAVFGFELFKELFLNIVRDLDPDRTHVPQMLPPELAIATGGAVLNAFLTSKRFTIVSGWEPKETPPAPGTRRADLGNVTLARHTLSLLVHPGSRARYEAPAQRFSVTLIPPTPPTAPDAVPPGALFAAWDGKLNVEGDVGGGVHQRIETSTGGWTRQPWSIALNQPGSLGVPGAKTVFSFLRPTTLKTGHGIDLRLTPSIGIALGFTSDAAGEHPSVELRLSLNDTEDRIAFVPERDGFLRAAAADRRHHPADRRDGVVGSEERLALPRRRPVHQSHRQGSGATVDVSDAAVGLRKDDHRQHAAQQEARRLDAARTDHRRRLQGVRRWRRRHDHGDRHAGDQHRTRTSGRSPASASKGSCTSPGSAQQRRAVRPFAASRDADRAGRGGRRGRAFRRRLPPANRIEHRRGHLARRPAASIRRLRSTSPRGASSKAAAAVIGRCWCSSPSASIRQSRSAPTSGWCRSAGISALNRTMDLDALRDAATTSQSNLDARCFAGARPSSASSSWCPRSIGSSRWRQVTRSSACWRRSSGGVSKKGRTSGTSGRPAWRDRRTSRSRCTDGAAGLPHV